MSKEQVIEKLTMVGFQVNEVSEEGLEGYGVTHSGFEGLSVWIEWKGSLVIVDSDPHYEVAHGNAGALILLAAVLPRTSSILIQCSDVSHLVNRHKHLRGWADVTEEDIRRFYPSEYNRYLAEDVQRIVLGALPFLYPSLHQNLEVVILRILSSSL